jgi:DNA-binding transcriptional LysR family regulator
MALAIIDDNDRIRRITIYSWYKIMDRLTGIEVFVRAIRSGGLSAAGRQMRLSPTMAGRHLDALEARLGTTLVTRTTRRLVLTEAGAAYLERAERILSELEEADADASAVSHKVEGLLRVSSPMTFGTLHVARLAAAFHEQNPGVTIELGLSDRYVDLLEERWDMAIRIGRLSDSSLVARRLATMQLAICAAPAYLARYGTPERADDLAYHICLGFTLNEATGSASWDFGPNGGKRVAVHGSLCANNGEALVAAAVAGQGLVYGPRFIAQAALERGDLVEVTLTEPLVDLGGVFAVTHPTRHPLAKTRAWINFLAREIPVLATRW